MHLQRYRTNDIRTFFRTKPLISKRLRTAICSHTSLHVNSKSQQVRYQFCELLVLVRRKSQADWDAL